MNNFTLDRCISWVKTTMEVKNEKFITIYEWNMLLTILQHLERLEVLEKENKIIKQSYFELGEAYAKILESNEKYSEENEELKKENEELKEKIERMKKIEKYNLRMLCDNPDLD